MRSFHCLVNPASGGGAAMAAVVPVARALREAGARVRVTYSPGPTACAALAREAADSGDVVVAVGGDGMLASVAGAVADAGGLLGVVPSGRGNDFARQLGIPRDGDRAAVTLLAAEPVAVDVIDTGDRVVLGSVYAGVDSLASAIVNARPRLPARLQYPYAAVRALLTHRPATYRIEVDGECHQHTAMTVVAANSGFYGGGMHIAPGASPHDGLLDVVVVAAASKAALVRALPKLYDGTHLELDEVWVLRGRDVRIRSDRPVVAYGDGEPVGDLPLTVTVRPAALRVLA